MSVHSHEGLYYGVKCPINPNEISKLEGQICKVDNNSTDRCWDISGQESMTRTILLDVLKSMKWPIKLFWKPNSRQIEEQADHVLELPYQFLHLLCKCLILKVPIENMQR